MSELTIITIVLIVVISFLLSALLLPTQTGYRPRSPRRPRTVSPSKPQVLVRRPIPPRKPFGTATTSARRSPPRSHNDDSDSNMTLLAVAVAYECVSSDGDGGGYDSGGDD